MSAIATATGSAAHTRRAWTLPARAFRLGLACLVCAALLASGYLVARTMDARPISVPPATVIAPVDN